MADRWSNPSGGLGVNRFRVWPSGSDSYNHSNLAQNWDTLDGIIGVPPSDDWPPTTGINGGIYREVTLLEHERTPIGAIVPWFRPSSSVPIPAFWHVCDGTTLASGHHAFPGIVGSVVLPDLRNKFVLGADPNLTVGQGAVAVGDGTIDTSAGAPGAQGTGGSNKITQTVNQLPSHNHGFSGVALPTHNHVFTGVALPTHNHHTAAFFASTAITWSNSFMGGGIKTGINNMAGITPASSVDGSLNLNTSSETAGTPTGSNSAISAGTPTGSISATGAGDPMDNRPNWVGLIFLCKVLYATTP